MGFRLEIDGAGPVKLTERAITKVEFGSEIRKIPMLVQPITCSFENLGQAPVLSGWRRTGFYPELGEMELSSQ